MRNRRFPVENSGFPREIQPMLCIGKTPVIFHLVQTGTEAQGRSQTASAAMAAEKEAKSGARKVDRSRSKRAAIHYERERNTRSFGGGSLSQTLAWASVRKSDF
jgi:hypothetical protein